MNLLNRVGGPLAIVLLLSACGGGSPDISVQQAALPVPAGVDDALWQEMQSELQRVRIENGRERSVSMAPRELGNRVSQIGTEDSGDGGVNVGWYYRNIGDYDLNGQVTISDLTPVGVGFQATAADPAWFSKGAGDGDANGEVNIADITPIGVHFGNAVTGYIVEHSTTPQYLGSYVPVAEVLFSEGSSIPGKVVAEITLPTETRQIYFEVKIAGLSPADSYGIRPFYEFDGKRELGIASYETKPPGQSEGWPMSGGNAQHTGLSDTYFSANAQLLANGGGLITAFSTQPAFDDDGNYYMGTADGRLLKFSANGSQLWETELGWRVNALEFTGTEFGVLAATDKGLSFVDSAGQILHQEALGRVLSRPVVLFEDASFRNQGGVTAAGRLWSVHLIKGSGVELAFAQDLGGPTPGNAVTSGLRIFTVVKGVGGADDTVVSTDFAGNDEQVHETAADIHSALRVGLDNRIWANIAGLRLQSWDPDGSASDMVTPSAGVFGAFDTDKQENRLWISREEGGGWSLMEWDTGFNIEKNQQPVGQPVVSLIDTGSHLAVALEDGKLASYDDALIERFTVDLKGGLTPISEAQLDFAAQVGSEGRVTVLQVPVFSGINNASGDIVLSAGDSLNEARLNIASIDRSAQILSNLLSQVEADLLNPPLIQKLGGPLDGPGVVATSSVLTKIPLSPTTNRTRVGITFRINLPPLDAPRLTDSLRAASSGIGGCGVAMYEDDGKLAWDEFFDDEEIGATSFSFRRLLMNASNLVANTHRVICLTEATGAELWSRELDSPGAAVPVADDDAQAYVITESGRLHKLNETGQDVWVENHPAPSTGLVLYGDNIYYGTTGDLVAVAISDGSLVFSESLPDGLDATPAISSSGLLMCVTTAGDLLSLDLAGVDHTPQLLFDGEGRAEAQPVCDGSGLVAWLTTDGIAHCADLGGNLLWEIDTYSTARAELSVGMDGTLYVLDELGRIAQLGQ